MNNTEINLKVGDKIKLKIGFLQDTLHLIYAGMPNEDTYSFILKKSMGYQGWAYNLFFPTSKKEIVLGKTRIQILNINPEFIVFRQI